MENSFQLYHAIRRAATAICTAWMVTTNTTSCTATRMLSISEVMRLMIRPNLVLLKKDIGIEFSLRHWLGAHAGRTRQDVRIAPGEDDDLAFLEPHRFLAEHGRVAAAFGDDVIGDQMADTRQNLGQHHLAPRLLGGPRSAGDDIEEGRAGEPDGLQNVR